MKTKMIAFAAVLLAATMAKAAADSYIYWMVSPEAKYFTGEDVVWDTAKVKVNGNYVTYWYGDGLDSGETELEALTAAEGGGSADLFWGAFEYNESTSFLFELYNGGELVGYSSAYQWIPSSVIFSGTSASGASPLVLSTIVPEPTSGLLMLLGFAGLALRRKRA